MDWILEKIYGFEKEVFQDKYQGGIKELKYEVDVGGFQAIFFVGVDVEVIWMWACNGVYVLISIIGFQVKICQVEVIWN